MPTWDPGQYAKFADDRLRPGLDLLERCPTIPARTVWDLGCGTGELTARLASRYPGARTIGLDSSSDMLAKARNACGISVHHGDIATWRPDEPADVIYSNAALHWLPDHATLFPRLMDHLAPGGVFACQMPNNFMEPSHRLMRALAVSGPWAAKTQSVRGIAPVARPDTYVDWLAPVASVIDMWETRYWHVLRGEDPVMEWVKGTGLRPFLDVLDPEERAAFTAAYADAVRPHYPRRADGTTLFPFPRLFIVAVRR